MIKRVLDISSSARLSIRKAQLLVERQENTVTVPLEDLAVVILSEPSIIITQSVLALCAANNIAIISCDKKHQPIGLHLPLSANTLHTRIIRAQIAASDTDNNMLWQKIVVAKIHAQSNLISALGKKPDSIFRFAQKVTPGDPSNYEAQAARAYWKHLLGTNFGRNPKEEGLNSILNYGYSILRSAVARSLCGAGLHPALGIHHRNQYNHFVLADDLMEPLRPIVDRTAYSILELNSEPTLTKEAKKHLVSLLGETLILNKKHLPLLTALSHYASSLKNCYLNGDQKLKIPTLP